MYEDIIEKYGWKTEEDMLSDLDRAEQDVARFYAASADLLTRIQEWLSTTYLHHFPERQEILEDLEEEVYGSLLMEFQGVMERQHPDMEFLEEDEILEVGNSLVYTDGRHFYPRFDLDGVILQLRQ